MNAEEYIKRRLRYLRETMELLEDNPHKNEIIDRSIKEIDIRIRELVKLRREINDDETPRWKCEQK